MKWPKLWKIAWLSKNKDFKNISGYESKVVFIKTIWVSSNMLKEIKKLWSDWFLEFQKIFTLILQKHLAHLESINNNLNTLEYLKTFSTIYELKMNAKKNISSIWRRIFTFGGKWCFEMDICIKKSGLASSLPKTFAQALKKSKCFK